VVSPNPKPELVNTKKTMEDAQSRHGTVFSQHNASAMTTY